MSDVRQSLAMAGAEGADAGSGDREAPGADAGDREAALMWKPHNTEVSEYILCSNYISQPEL